MNVRTDETSLMTSLIKVMIRVNIYITFLIKIVDISVKKVVAPGQVAKFLCGHGCECTVPATYRSIGSWGHSSTISP